MAKAYVAAEVCPRKEAQELEWEGLQLVASPNQVCFNYTIFNTFSSQA